MNLVLPESRDCKCVLTSIKFNCTALFELNYTDDHGLLQELNLRPTKFKKSGYNRSSESKHRSSVTCLRPPKTAVYRLLPY